MDAAKLRLSQEELALVSNAQWILTKNTIVKKAISLFAQVQSQQNQILSATTFLPANILSMDAKISKGENYRGLPYIVLDQPRLFQKEDAFAIRHMFWWGHFFSSTLYLSGTYKIQLAEKLTLAYELLKHGDYYICVNEDPWQHHFEETNLIAIKSISADRYKEIVHYHPFIKIAAKFSLSEWENAEEKLVASFRLYLSIAD